MVYEPCLLTRDYLSEVVDHGCGCMRKVYNTEMQMKDGSNATMTTLSTRLSQKVQQPMLLILYDSDTLLLLQLQQ
jgi:hypothetical protein